MSSNRHAGWLPQGWVTVRVCPPTVSLPVRLPPVFFVTEYVTQPLPFPLPDRTSSHDESLVAFHVQPDEAVILTLAALPAVGDMLEVCPNW